MIKPLNREEINQLKDKLIYFLYRSKKIMYQLLEEDPYYSDYYDNAEVLDDMITSIALSELPIKDLENTVMGNTITKAVTEAITRSEESVDKLLRSLGGNNE